MKNNLFKSTLLLLLALSMSSASFAQQFKVLLFTKTAGFHHESIHEGVTAIRQLAARNSFTVVWQENASVFNDKDLADFSAVIFLSTTGDILNDEQQAAFERFIRSGKGFVGVHAASDTEYDWAWYTKLVGMMFKIHPAQQTAYLKVEDSNFPGMERFPKKLLWTDEWYEFGELKSKDLHYLVSIDEKSYNPYAKWGTNEGKGMGNFHPISWYHNYDGGRAFYTALGHIPLTYSDQTFLDHLYGGIYWAATGKGL
ncbi:ThuA domain-containing protein [Arcicella rigui]|uniref:ThuA domain-containing protein n=1 Tax=Arcicella rigui TaxID=797020 RepID=A0ABU5QDJ6_9BACT|nr:ThuA domain-containing protein [Arcicella rigui]MEA5140915.1 ThuA domain-containing protein [Arcicella rigui]